MFTGSNMYYITPNHSVAINPKVCSSTLARAIIAAFHPEQERMIRQAAYPDGVGPDDVMVHWLCPKEKEPSKPVVLVVREPVSRFISAMAQMKLTDAESVLAALEAAAEYQLPRKKTVLANNPHFRHQHQLARRVSRLFRLNDFDAAATYIGLTLPLPVINEARNEKPTLTPEQEARALAYYAADKSLYEAIPVGGVDYT